MTQLYLGTSALVKLAVVEAETSALTAYLDAHGSDTRISSALVRAELLRAVAPYRSVDVVGNAREIFARLELVALSNNLLDRAVTLKPDHLRTLDAIHVAAAMTAPNLRALLTYDTRMSEAAAAHGIAVASPH